ncbi:MAG: hypothetical protein U1F43_39025 [Myxococcota bacterium]
MASFLPAAACGKSAPPAPAPGGAEVGAAADASGPAADASAVASADGGAGPTATTATPPATGTTTADAAATTAASDDATAATTPAGDDAAAAPTPAPAAPVVEKGVALLVPKGEGFAPIACWVLPAPSSTWAEGGSPRWDSDSGCVARIAVGDRVVDPSGAAGRVTAVDATSVRADVGGAFLVVAPEGDRRLAGIYPVARGPLVALADVGRPATPVAVAPAVTAVDAAADAGPTAADVAPTPEADAAAAPTVEADAAPTPPPQGDDADPVPVAAPAGPSPYLPIASLPVTLHYVRDGLKGFAIQLSDAGIPGLANDFKVKRLPEGDDGAWCLSGTYFGDFPSADNTLKATGCYLARPDGLWHFETCPTSADADADPVKAGGTLDVPVPPMKETKLVAGEPEPDKVSGLAKAVIDGKPIDVQCDGSSDAGMSKSVEFSACASPLYGLVSTEGSWTEMQQLSCKSEVHLVAVEPGLHEPKSCLVEPGLVGAYRFTTRVYHAKDGKGRGTTGHYGLTLAMGDGCKLEASVEKRGIDDKAFAPEAVQKGKATLALGCDDAELGPNCWKLAVHLADAAGKGFDAVYTLGFKDGALRGAWHYDKGDLASGLSGLLQGKSGDGAALAFDRKQVDRQAECRAAFCSALPDGGEECSDDVDTCIHCKEIEVPCPVIP